MSWFNRYSDLEKAIALGDLDGAFERLKQSQTAKASTSDLAQRSNLTKRLTNALIDRSNAHVSQANLIGAWKDLGTAADIALPSDRDLVSRHTGQLVELTLEAAEAQLKEGRTSRSLQLVDQLSDRKILDWRADRIRRIADRLHESKSLAAEGKFEQAIARLTEAQRMQPELDHIAQRIAHKEQQWKLLSNLTQRLQSLALSCQWHEVNQCCQQILALAPQHQIAIAAQNHAKQRLKRRTSAGSKLTNVPDRSSSTRVTDSNSFFEVERETDRGMSTTQVADPEQAAQSHDASSRDAIALSNSDAFLMWVDGVGGYLVCIRPVVLIGQALAGSSVTIALQADLRKRHARLELIAGQHLVQPLGPMTLDGKVKDAAFVLRHGQELGLGDGVCLSYSQSHPLSKTSRLDFLSRHRTQPWSDAVLLASQSIVLGPNHNNHVVCPSWQSDLILFTRNDRWFCRSRRPIQVDGNPMTQESEFRFNSHITGQDFSLTLEPVVRSNGELHGN